jgi:tetratricopeptide (TPR) repeat protein
LALFLHTLGHFEAALKHIRRALYLFELICGPNHPDTAATHINIAMIYQDSGKIPLGLQHLQEALKRNRAALGDSHSQVALSHHAIAVAYGLCGAFRQALTHEKQAKAIYTAVHGPEHQLVQQSVYWLNQFTTGAVRHAKGSTPDQNVLNLLSPLTWVSLRSSISFRGRLTMNDVLQLIETAAEREQHSINVRIGPIQTTISVVLTSFGVSL